MKFMGYSRSIYDVPIRQKLGLIMSATTFIALLMAIAVFFVEDTVYFKNVKLKDFKTLSQILGVNCTAALSFDDSKAAEEILQTLVFRPHVVFAALYDDKGREFAVYRRRGESPLINRASGPDGHHFGKNKLTISAPIFLYNKRIGTLYLERDLRELQERFRYYAGLTGITLLTSFFLSFIFSSAFQRIVTRPLLELSRLAKNVSEKRDYSIRGKKYGNDELGNLTDTVNEMLAEIQKQSEELRQLNEKALRESEERYRTLFESIDEGFCIFEMIYDKDDKACDYRFLELSPSFEKQSGLKNALGKTMLELSPSHEKKWFEIFGKIADTGQAVRFQDFAEYQQRWFDVYAFRFGAPEKRQVAALFSDITERKKYEKTLTQKTLELEYSNKELEAFSYSVSHDLRAPLRHIDGFVDLLKKRAGDSLEEKSKGYLKTISDSAKQMGCLIDDLLVFSKMGRAEVKCGKVSFDALVQEVLNEMKSDLNGRAIDWKIAKLPEGTGDYSMLRQVFVNLISNAVKYTGTRERAVIEIGFTDGAEETVFFVKDNGVGFDMQYVNKLFGVFQRLHRAEDFEGTGIGLANVRRIVSRHGGKTWAESFNGAGAAFYFSLPK